MKSAGEREKRSKKEGKRGDRWRNIRGRKRFKKQKERGGIWVGHTEWRGVAETLLRRLSLLGLAPLTDIVACVH